MKWFSNDKTIIMAKSLEHLLPKDFDYNTYISLNPDLNDAGICDYQSCKEHYLFFGMMEGRQYKAEISTDNHLKYKCEKFFNSKNLLYLAPSAPDFDRSSGGLRLLEILKILKINLDYKIYFLCNTKIDKKYVDKLTELNIIWYSLEDKIPLKNYFQIFKDKKIHFDNCIISWYDMGRQYIDIIKNFYPNIKIISDTVDVHWLREQRGVDNNELNMSSNILSIRKKIEKNVYLKSDVILAITDNDKKELHNELGNDINIKILGNIHHEQKPILDGKDILYIGNYDHLPNRQAAIECINIYKKFKLFSIWKEKKPNLILAGYNMPQNIISMAKDVDNINIFGYTNDLEKIYKNTMVLMAPLFWGAGIKGKICDSAMRSVLILTSNIGNEGINLEDGISGYIAENTDQFVKKLEIIYSQNRETLNKISDSGKKVIQSIVSTECAETTLKHTLGDKHIVISIVAYKNYEKLNKCLKSIIEKSGYTNYTIYITDNSSENKNQKVYKEIKKIYPSIDILYEKNKSNEYFILPNNKTIKKYPDSDVLLINDDIEIITNNFLSILYSSAYSYYNIAAVGAKTIFPNGTLAEAGAELYQNGYGNNIGRGRNPKELCFNIPKFVGYCSGCFLYMRRDAIDKIGVLDEDLEKMYYEDSEWQYRAHINGLKTLYQPMCEAIHDEGSSAGNDISVGSKRFQEINRIKFVEKYKNYEISKYNS